MNEKMKIRAQLQFPFNFEKHASKQYTQELVNHLYSLVEKACCSLHNKFGYSIWQNHVLLVVKYAKLLAQQLRADEEVCEISALLHDYAGILDFNLYEDHHVHSARIAHELLLKLEYPKDKVEHIKHCILSHRASKNIPRKTKEANIIASADAIAHIIAWESLLDLALFEYSYAEPEAKAWVARKLSRSYQKIMPEALLFIEEKYKLIKIALDASIPLIPSE